MMRSAPVVPDWNSSMIALLVIGSIRWFGILSLFDAVTRPTALGRWRNLAQFLLELSITQGSFLV